MYSVHIVCVYCSLHVRRKHYGKLVLGGDHVKSKPLHREEEEEVEMEGLQEAPEDSLMDTPAGDKDDYYFEDPSNISTGPLPPDLQGVTHCLIWPPSQ